MPRIVLVHGGCHGAWCWDRLLPLLDDAVAVEQRERGDGGAVIVAVLDRPSVLVGHSLGGMAISAAAELAPDRIVRLAYLSALLPIDGESAASMALPPLDAEAATVIEGEWCRLDPVLATPILYQDCEPGERAFALDRIGPTHLSRITASAALSADRFGAVPKTYIHCLADRAIQLDAQRAMTRRYDGIDTLSLPTGHSPFLSQPQLLARTLAALA